MPLPADTFTPAMLAERVLRRLGVVSAGQQPTADDAAMATDSYGDLWNEWTKTGQIEFAFEAVPREMVDGLSRVLEARLGPAFGVIDRATAAQLEDDAKRRFFVVNADVGSSGPDRSAYF